MPISNSSLPTVPDGLHFDELTLDPSGLLLLARTTAAQAVCPGPPPLKWLFAKFGGSGCEEEPSAEEIEIGATVHGALQELETRDLPFGLPTAPRECQRSPDSVSVLTEADSKVLDDADAAVLGVAQPFIERRDIRSSRWRRITAAPDDPAEAATEIDDLGRLGILQDARDHCGSLGIKVFGLTQEMPG